MVVFMLWTPFKYMLHIDELRLGQFLSCLMTTTVLPVGVLPLHQPQTGGPRSELLIMSVPPSEQKWQRDITTRCMMKMFSKPMSTTGQSRENAAADSHEYSSRESIIGGSWPDDTGALGRQYTTNRKILTQPEIHFLILPTLYIRNLPSHRNRYHLQKR